MNKKMKTQYYAATSLDGFIATEKDSLEWLFPLGDLNNSSYPEFISRVGALTMGSSTYEWIVHNEKRWLLRLAQHGHTVSQLGYSLIASFQLLKARTSNSSAEMCAKPMLKCEAQQVPKTSG